MSQGNHSTTSTAHTHPRQLRGRRVSSSPKTRKEPDAPTTILQSHELPSPPRIDLIDTPTEPSLPASQSSSTSSSSYTTPHNIAPLPRDMTTQAISQLLLTSPHEHNNTDSNSGVGEEAALVPAKYFKGTGNMGSSSTTHHATAPSSDTPYLMLLVPSSSITSKNMPTPPTGAPPKDSSLWVEIGCKLFSARYVDDLSFHFPPQATGEADGDSRSRTG